MPQMQGVSREGTAISTKVNPLGGTQHIAAFKTLWRIFQDMLSD